MDILKLINTSVILSSASNLRGRHTTLTSIVNNKLILRDEVLRAHSGGSGSNFTKEVLRGSSFFSAELFGPLPNSLLTRCAHSSQYMLKPFKASSSGGQSSSAQNVPTPYNSQAAVSTPSSSHRGFYHNYTNYQQYNNDSHQSQQQDYNSRQQSQQQVNNSRQNQNPQNKAPANRGFFFRKRHQRFKTRPVAPAAAPLQAKRNGN